MNPRRACSPSSVMQQLLEIVSIDPLPAAHTSSHWQHHGCRTVVREERGGLTLQPSGFEAVSRSQIREHLLHRPERWSYRSVTSSMKSFPPIWARASSLVRELSGSPNFYVFKSACALAVLADHWAQYALRPTSLMVIGDGYGFFGALARRWLPGVRLWCVDLPKTLVFQVRTHHAADPQATTSLLLPEEPADVADITFVLPQHIERIEGEIDCAVTIASMQEMTPASIEAYFAVLRRRSGVQSRFYCVNRLSKTLPGGEVADFHAYPWRPEDEIFLDGPCPYYTHFFAPYTLRNGPRVLGIRVPCVNDFDGMIMHRLVRLAPER